MAASPWKPTTLLRSTDDVAALKETDGGEIQVHGSADWRFLAAAGLVDRYHLLVFPLVLGTGGKRLYADGGKTKLQLVDQASYSNGVQKLCYDVVR